MNYGKKSTQKREKELTSKSTMIRKKFYVIFCKYIIAKKCVGIKEKLKIQVFFIYF